MFGLLERFRNWRLRHVEKLLTYVIIWTCIIFLHMSFKKTQIVIKEDVKELEKVVTEKEAPENVGDFYLNKLSKEDLEKVKKLEEEEKSKIKQRDANELKRLAEEKAKRFKPVSKYKERDVLKWLSERPKPTGNYNMTKVHPKLPKYLIVEKDTCKYPSLDFLFYFNSHPANFQKRSDLRKAWARPDLFEKLVVKTIFVLGDTESKEQKARVEEESNKYHDIIQGSLNDTYRNISLKALLMLDWVDHYCPQAKYIIKADDDFFVNPFLMIENMISQVWEKPKVAMCHIKKENSVITDKKSKWYIAEDMLPEENKKTLPQFCAGYVVVFSGNLVPELRKAALDTPIIPVDDVYLFGFLMKGVKDVEIINAVNHYTLNLESGLAEYSAYQKEIVHVAVIAFQQGAMEHLWDKTVDRLTPLGQELANKKLIPSE